MIVPRAARQQSQTGIYHVILRGINRQQIFFDDEDSETFIRLLKQVRDVSGFDLYAYCLMGNHVHLLLRAREEGPERIFRRLGASYVYWYNLKYRRVGHLFQDRFKSEPVENEAYFLTALRYILRNPVKAGLCQTPESYKYSNCAEIIGETAPILPCELSGEDLARYIAREQDDKCMDVDGYIRRGVTDSVAKEAIREEFGLSAPVVSGENRQRIDESIRRLTEKGLSIRQISRLTGLSKSIVERASK